MHELIARQHQFADQRHQVFQHFHRNANRLLRCGGFGLHRLGHRFGGAGRGCCGRRDFNRSFSLGLRRRWQRNRFAARRCIQGRDHRGIIAIRFLTMLFKPHNDLANGIHRGENQRNPLRGDFQAAVTIEAQDGFSGVRHLFQP